MAVGRGGEFAQLFPPPVEAGFGSEAVEKVGRAVAIFGEQTDLSRQLGALVEGVQNSVPCSLLRVVDLAQVKGGALGRVAGVQPVAFDDTPAAMDLAVLFPGV